MKNVARVFFVFFVFLPCFCFSGPITIPSKGITEFKTDRSSIMMLYSEIDRGSPHPEGMVNFVIPTASGPATHIPFELKKSFGNFLNISKGADCNTSQLGVVQNGKKFRVIYGEREGMWAEEYPVVFHVFELMQNLDQEIDDHPLWYFKEVKKITSKTKYCDVGDALVKESALFSK